MFSSFAESGCFVIYRIKGDNYPVIFRASGTERGSERERDDLCKEGNLKERKEHRAHAHVE